MGSKDREFREITIDKECLTTPLGQRYPNAKLVEERPKDDFYRDGKYELHISAKKGDAFHICSSLSDNYICCSAHVLRNMSNCPFDCSYCFLQNYLNNGNTMVVADIPSLVSEIKEKTAREPWRFFRIGTWELADSLAWENQCGNTAELIEAFSTVKNGFIELRTKSAIVDPILNLDHKRRTIVSWSLSPDRIIKSEEFGTATLNERLDAMVKVVEAGYLIALHFDPILYCDNWSEEYINLVKEVFSRIPQESVVWISMGVLRFNPEMKKKIENNFPKSKITCPEIVPGPDGKLRYIKPLRVDIFKKVLGAIRQYGGDKPFVYLCMEYPDVWKKVMGYAPESINHLDYLIAKSIYDRFPELTHTKPNFNLYKTGLLER